MNPDQTSETSDATTVVTRWEAFAALDDDGFASVLDEVTCHMEMLLAAKRRSYGPHNLAEFGDVGVLIRTNDKLKRLIHMWQQGLDTTAVGEDAIDAWTDIAGYALLVLVAHKVGQSATITRSQAESEGV